MNRKWLGCDRLVGGGLSGGGATPDAILISGSDVYVGGDFTQAGTTAASHIARWDGTAWHALGSGVDGTVYALTMYNGKLWVGGSFAHAGTAAASDVAIWDPTHSTWSKVGGGLHFDGTELVEVVADRPDAAAWRVERGPDGTVVETRVEPTRLD